MTPAEKHNYQQRFHRFQQSREIHFAPKFLKAIQEQYRVYIFNYNYYGTAAINKIESTPVRRILTNLSTDAVRVYGQKVVADLKASRQKKKYFGGVSALATIRQKLSAEDIQVKRMPIGFSERIEEIMRQYFTLDIINNSEEITQTTREFLLRPDVQEMFLESLKRGDGIDDIIRQFTGLQNNRGRLIARTETVSAANKSALVVAKDTGLDLLKEWLPTNDARTRKHHAAMAGQKVGADDYFIVKDAKGIAYQMDAPGDRGGKDGRLRVPASLVCNCRCCVVHEVIDNDRPINPRPIIADRPPIATRPPIPDQPLIAPIPDKPPVREPVRENILPIIQDTSDRAALIARISALLEKLQAKAHHITFVENAGKTTPEALEIIEIWSNLRERLQEIIFLSQSVASYEQDLITGTEIFPLRTQRYERDKVALKNKIRAIAKWEAKANAIL